PANWTSARNHYIQEPTSMIPVLFRECQFPGYGPSLRSRRFTPHDRITLVQKMTPALKAAIAVTCFAAVSLPLSAATPMPKVTGPLPVTTDSRPFLAANRVLQPLDLKKAGYVEEEFIVSGKANVYDWEADGSLKVKTADAPYATRILVRRPANRSRFSGHVVVELLNPARRFDWAMMSGYVRDSLMERGDAWVGITMPGSVASLAKFNAG